LRFQKQQNKRWQILQKKHGQNARRKTMDKDTALDLALEALGWTDEWRPEGLAEKAITAIKQARSAPVQEPVAWGNLANWCLDSDRVLITDKTEAEKYHRDVYDLTPLYTAPPAAQPTAEDSSVVAAPVQEPDHGDELTIAYMSGLHDGKKKRDWVGLTDECRKQLINEVWSEYITGIDDGRTFGEWMSVATEAKLKEKNT
jgi:hypothetical protein